MIGNGPAVEVCALTKTFGAGAARIEALRGVDLRVEHGEFLAVMGPSGSGKSTLLHLIGGLDAPTSGTIRIAGEDLQALDDDRLTLLRRRRIGFVFQAFNLLDILTCEENTVLPLVLDGVSEMEAAKKAQSVLDMVDLGRRRKHFPNQLSGGEQQRLAMARALVTDPVLLLADEPTGNLDSTNSDQVMALLRSLADQRRQTIVMVTHDPRHAAMADRLVRLRDGRVADEQPLERGRPMAEVLQDLELLP
jgi:putative ABC transport system ATP-binding protein